MQSTLYNKRLAKVFAEKFIARSDVKAFQQPDGTYRPDRSPITMDDLLGHIEGRHTLGHYMVKQDDTVKLFAFDIDLNKDGFLPTGFDENPDDNYGFSGWTEGNPRESWRARQPGPARNFLKYGMHYLAHGLAANIQNELQIPAAVAYSGSKGVHVYGFTGPTSAELARKGAGIVLESIGKWKLFRGRNFFKYDDPDFKADDHEWQFKQFSLEIYPKQDTLEDKDLGNLMRLPLGRNLRSPKDPTFFVDLRCALSELETRNALEALTATNAFA
jgi:hypothetical protein